MGVLIDTGILLRAFVLSDPHCQPIRESFRLLRRQREEFFTSFQNVAEFTNVSTRPASARGGYGLSSLKVESRVRFIERLCRLVTEDPVAYAQWKQLVAKYQVSGVAIHDTRLVAAMLTHNVRRVLTLNEGDFRRYESEGIEVVTPKALLSKA